MQNIPVSAAAYTVTTSKSFDDVCAELERLSQERQFRTLAVHDVQATLADKGFERKPLKIIEVCNASFAHQALAHDIHVSLFMPCKFVVAEQAESVTITLGRPSMIARILPDAGVEELAQEVEERLKGIMRDAA